MRTQFGIITEVSGNRPLFNGEPVDLSLQPDAPREATIEAVFDGDTLMDWQYDLTSWPEREKTPWHVALAWADTDDIEEAQKYAKELQDRHRQIGQGRWDVQVRVFMVKGMGFGTPSLDHFDFRGFSRHVREAAPDFKATHWLVVGGWHSGNCGFAPAGGEIGWAQRGCASDTGNHELFHNGITRKNHVIHAGMAGDQYGAGTLQGRRNRDDVSSVHLDIMGVIEENNVRTLVPGESGLFFLTQGSADPLALRPGEDKLVYCLLGNGKIRKLAIEYHDGKVWVHKPSDNSDRFRQTWVLAKISAGIRETIEGVAIEFISAKDGAAKVYVNHHHDTTEIPRSDFPQWTAPENAYPLTEDMSGIWNNPAWNSQGLLVRVNNGRVAAHWIGWSRLGYQHQFRWINSTITGNYAEGPLYSTGDDRKAIESGTAIVYWYGPDLGIMRGYDKVLGRFAVPLHRLGQGTDDPVNGYYGLGNDEGLAINKMDNGQYVGFWLTQNTSLLGLGKTTQHWQMVQGPSLDALTIREITGGMAWVDAETKDQEVGPAVISGGQFNGRSMVRLA